MIVGHMSWALVVSRLLRKQWMIQPTVNDASKRLHFDTEMEEVLFVLDSHCWNPANSNRGEQTCIGSLHCKRWPFFVSECVFLS
jgi:hypothetical protein